MNCCKRTAEELRVGDEIVTSPYYSLQKSTRKIRHVVYGTNGVRICLDNGRWQDFDFAQRVEVVDDGKKRNRVVAN